MKIKVLTCDLEEFQERLEKLSNEGWVVLFESYNCFHYEDGFYVGTKCSIILVEK